MAHYERERQRGRDNARLYRNTSNEGTGTTTFDLNRDLRPKPRYPASQAPLLVEIHRPRSPFRFGKTRRTKSVAGVENTGTGSGSGSESGGSSAQSATSAPSQQETSVGRSTGTGTWLNGRNRRGMGLGDAFARTDENGNYRPRTAPGIIRTGEQEHGMGAGVSESRIPISRTYIDSAPALGSSPPQIIKDMFTRALSEERGMTPAPEDNGSESSGPRDGSPSPAAPRDRRQWGLDTDKKENISPIHMVEDPTADHFDQKMSTFAERQARLGRMANDPTPVFVPHSKPTSIFQRYRGEVGPRVAETTMALARKTSTGGFEDANGIARKTSLSSFEDEPEPPISLRGWGAKARKRPDWIRKILSPEEFLEVKDAPPTAEAELESALEDIPLPSVEYGASQQEPTPPSSRPASAQPNNESPEKSRLWTADLDFTAQSIQVSNSPALRVRSTKLDEIREREIESLTARAVATNRLEEIRERNSEERSLRETTPNPQKVEEPEYHERTILEEEGYQIPNTPVTIFPAGSYRPKPGTTNFSAEMEDSFEVLRKLSKILSPSPAPERIAEEEKLEAKEEKAKDPETSAEKVAESKPQTVSERVAARVAERRRERQMARSTENQAEDPAEKPAETRFQRATARSTENIGKPETEIPVQETSHEKSEKVPETEGANLRKNRNLDIDSENKRRSTSDVDPEERIVAEAKLFELQDNKSERNSIRAPSRSPSPSDDEHLEETPRPKADPLSLPTPRVTGAYIETPVPSTRSPRKQRSISSSYELVDPVDGASSSDNQNTQQSRVDSASNTEDLERDSSRTPARNTSRLHTSRRTSSRRELGRPQTTTSRPPLINSARPTTAAEDLRRLQLEDGIEDSTLDEFDALLETDVIATSNQKNDLLLQDPILSSVYDEKELAMSVAERERRLERIILARMEQRLRNTSTSIRDARQGIERLEHEVSSAPRGSAEVSDDGSSYIRLEIKLPRVMIPRLITYNPEPTMRGRNSDFWNRNWKFTWLGLFLLLFSFWYLAESAMCGVYCKPENSSRGNWKPSDPLFPWAIPTKLDQWTGEVASTILYDMKDGWDQWYDPGGLKRKRRIVPGSARDWWLGRDGPQPIYKPPERAGTMDEDEIWIG